MYQFKSNEAHIKGVDLKNRVVEGYFSVFNVKDSDGDIIKPGAFAKTIAENGPDGKNRIMHLLQHNPIQPLGKPQELKEDEKGLFFVTKIAETSYGTDTLKLYADKVLEEHSIGFNVIKSNWSDEHEANILTDIKLWEGSSVTWGANEFARTTSMKSMSKSQLLERYDTLSKAFYKGDYTDDTFRILQAQRTHIETLLKQALEPDETTLSLVTCGNCNKTFDYNSMLESGMGYVKCPNCKEPVTMKSKEPDRTTRISELFTEFNRKQHIRGTYERSSNQSVSGRS